MQTTDVRNLARKGGRGAVTFWSIVRQSGADWIEDEAMTWAAAVACYTLLALGPILVIVVRVASVTMGPNAKQRVAQQITNAMGSASADAINAILDKVMQPGRGVMATVISSVLVLFTATGAFAELQLAMNRIWDVKPKPRQAVWNFVRARLVSLGVLLAAASLLAASVFMATWLTAATRELGVGGRWVAWIVDVLVSVGALTVVFAVVYKLLPDVNIGWQSIWVGAAITAVLFEVGKYALAMYFRFGAPSSAYGAVGSLAAVLIWIYYSAQVFFFGAEFTQAYANLHGHTIEPTEHSVKVDEARDDGGLNPPAVGEVRRPRKIVSPQPAAAPRSKITVAAAAGVGACAVALVNWLKQPDRRLLESIRLEHRLDRIERRVAPARRIRRALDRDDLFERIDDVERQLSRTVRKARRAAHRPARAGWVQRLVGSWV